MRLLGVIILAGLCFLSARAEDWKTTGTSSPAAETTELGRYKAKVYMEVASHWYAKVDNKQLQLLEDGMVKIQYTIHYDGSVQIKVLAGSDLPFLLAVSKNAITEAAPFPPFTDSMRKQVGDSFTDAFTFTVKPPGDGPQSSISH
jgi:hypothetical protein